MSNCSTGSSSETTTLHCCAKSSGNGWLWASILALVIAFGGVAIVKLMLKHDALAEESVRSEQTLRATMRSMQAEINKERREKLAAQMAHRIIGQESNGHNKARSFDRDVHGHSYGPAQWKRPSWDEAVKRHRLKGLDMNSYEDQYELTVAALLANEGHLWSTCRRDEECRKNFTRRGK